MIGIFAITAFVVIATAVLFRPQPASAHCDTMDGPTATDGIQALETGNLALAGKWVTADGEAELKSIFDRAIAARKLGAAAREVADRWFLENLVRIHRAGEGAAFTGLQSSGAPVDPRVAAADRSIEVGNLEPLAGLISEERWPELERRFTAVLKRRHYPVDDVDAGRHYVEAYVNFFKFAEGHDDDHAHGHDHAH